MAKGDVHVTWQEDEAKWSVESRCGRGSRRTGCCHWDVGRDAVCGGAVSVPGESGDLSPHGLHKEPGRHDPGLGERCTGAPCAR